MTSLREKAIKGGAFLLMRQAIGSVVSVVGVLLVTRIIGPYQYGLYVAASGIALFLSTVGAWGLDAHLLRMTEEPQEQEFNQAFTLMVLISAVLCGGVIGAHSIVSRFLKIPQEAPILFAMAFSVPLPLLAMPAVVKLDRDLNFKRVAINELVSQISQYIVTVPLALAGLGAWAAVAGFLTRQGCLLALSYQAANYRPALYWQSSLVKRMLNYGLGYSSSTWVWQLRRLVNPLIVGRYGGAEGVAYVGIAVRIAEMLAFASTVTWRIALPALAKLHNEAGRLRTSITEGMRFQAVAVGVPLASFALAAPFLIPLGLGHNWSSASKVFPFIALGYLSNAMITMPASVLYLFGKNMQMTSFWALHIVLFAGSAAFLVPRFGYLGYGWSEIVALPSYFVIHLLLVKVIGCPSYAAPAIWYATSASVIVLGALGSPALYFGFAALAAPFFFRKERATLSSYATIIFSRVVTPA